MNSLGIFHDVKIKNNSNVLFSLRKACDQTSNLVDYMDNYQKPSNHISHADRRNNYKFNLKNYNNQKRNQSMISRIGKNIINSNNSLKMKKKNSELFKSLKKPKVNKYKELQNKLFGNNDNNNEEKYNDPFDYNKEYENNLINQIDNLFNPIKNDNNIEFGSLRNILKNDYMDPFSLMGNEYKL